MSFRPLAVALSLAVSGGCSADSTKDGFNTGGTPSSSTTEPTTGATTGSTHGTNSAEYFALIGSVAVVAEAVDPVMSTLEVDYRNEDGEPICSGIRPILGATAEVNPDPEVPLFGLWSLELGPSPCGPFGPDTVRLGIGAWDPALTPAAEAENLMGADLYGLYLTEAATEATVVFGATGTSEQFSGDAPPVTAGPLPDGVYQLRTLYLLPLSP